MQARSQCTNRVSSILIFAFAALFLLATAAFAGPPLICHAFDIGGAKSLPWISHDWNLAGSESYDTRNLADDTLAILNSSDVPLVHMETLRRATLYARKDPQAAKRLLVQLVNRAEASAASGHPDAFAMLDAGYIIEAYKQWPNSSSSNLGASLDGVTWVEKAVQLRPSDAQLNFAAAMVTLKGSSTAHEDYAQKAAGAHNDPLLARNLATHFIGSQSPLMSEMILRGNETKVAKQ